MTASNLDLFAALCGTLLPPFVAMVNRSAWSPTAKAIAAALCSVLVGFGVAWFGGQFDPADITRSILIVFTLGQVSYQTFWRPSRIAPNLESATG